MDKSHLKYQRVSMALGLYSCLVLLCMKVNISRSVVAPIVSVLVSLIINFFLFIGPVGIVVIIWGMSHIYRIKEVKHTKRGLIIPILSTLVTLFTLGYNFFLALQ